MCEALFINPGSWPQDFKPLCHEYLAVGLLRSGVGEEYKKL